MLLQSLLPGLLWAFRHVMLSHFHTFFVPFILVHFCSGSALLKCLGWRCYYSSEFSMRWCCPLEGWAQKCHTTCGPMRSATETPPHRPRGRRLFLRSGLIDGRAGRSRLELPLGAADRQCGPVGCCRPSVLSAELHGPCRSSCCRARQLDMSCPLAPVRYGHDPTHAQQPSHLAT